MHADDVRKLGQVVLVVRAIHTLVHNRSTGSTAKWRGWLLAAFLSRLISRWTKYEPFSMLTALSVGWRVKTPCTIIDAIVS